MPRGPLADRYAGAVALVICSLIPYLALTAGIFPLAREIGASLRLSTGTLDLAIALSTGAYALGTVIAVQMAVRLRSRRMLVVYEVLFVVASVLAAWAPDGAVFIGAFVVQGLCTSLLLIAAVPPLVTAWPPAKMPITAAVMNLCIFGAVAIGPTLGAWVATTHQWRLLFWAVAGVAALAATLSVLTFEDAGPADTDAPWDPEALVLAVLGCGAAFYGAGQLQASTRPDVGDLVPLLAGTGLLVLLVARQYAKRQALMPVRAAATSMPVTGVLLALCASAAAFGIMELVLEMLQKTATPGKVALLFLPEFAGAILLAVVFGRLFTTRYVPVLAMTGLVLIAASAGLLALIVPSSGGWVAAVTGLLGLGVGATVSPALFMVGFSLRSSLLQRVFALIELLRGVTAFLLAPILLYLAAVLAKGAAGLRDVALICMGIAVGGFGLALVSYLGAKPDLEAPDLEAWQGDADEPAWRSPPVLDRLRRPRRGPLLDTARERAEVD